MNCLYCVNCFYCLHCLHSLHKTFYILHFRNILHDGLWELTPLTLLTLLREGSSYQIGWIFGKIPNGLSPPNPHFWKIMLQFFYNGYGCIYARRYEGQIVWNACTCLLQSVSCFDFSQYNCWKNIPWTLKLLFCINFMLKKPCLKFPNLQFIFLY